MSLWKSLPISKQLASWREASKGDTPTVSVIVDMRQNHGGGIALVLVAATNVSVRKVSGVYSASASRPQYWMASTGFQVKAIEPDKPFEERILRVEAPAADEIWLRQAEITISIHLKFEMQTGETHKRHYDAVLKRGRAQFEVHESA
jgi:hypothetical protein